jgi:hypothetical protein
MIAATEERKAVLTMVIALSSHEATATKHVLHLFNDHPRSLSRAA